MLREIVSTSDDRLELRDHSMENLKTIFFKAMAKKIRQQSYCMA